MNTKLAINSLIEELQEELDLNSSAVMEQRFNYFKIPSTEVFDYSERVINLSEGKAVLAGIRHTGGNIQKPFVSLWPNFILKNNSDIESLINIMASEFKIFKPKHIKLWLNPNSTLAKEVEHSYSSNQRYIVGSVSDIINLEKPKRYSEIEFIQIKNNEYRDWYIQTYKEFHASQPELIDLVPINDEEDINQCINDCLFFYTTINGKKSGFIGANHSNILGCKGAYISEILISKEFKGQGYAPVIQKKFIEKKLTHFDYIWGTIDSHNIPSTKTALKVGRKPIRTEYFVPIN